MMHSTDTAVLSIIAEETATFNTHVNLTSRAGVKHFGVPGLPKRRWLSFMTLLGEEVQREGAFDHSKECCGHQQFSSQMSMEGRQLLGKSAILDSESGESFTWSSISHESLLPSWPLSSRKALLLPSSFPAGNLPTCQRPLLSLSLSLTFGLHHYCDCLT